MIKFLVIAVTTVLNIVASQPFDTCIGKCPRSNNPFEIPTLLAHEDCSKYCYCDNGCPTVKKCPGNFHFSLDERMCLPVGLAKCDDRKNCLGMCPLIYNTQNVLLLRHSNTNKYCHCREWGIPTVETCPESLVFNFKHAQCQKPIEDCNNVDDIERPLFRKPNIQSTSTTTTTSTTIASTLSSENQNLPTISSDIDNSDSDDSLLIITNDESTSTLAKSDDGTTVSFSNDDITTIAPNSDNSVTVASNNDNSETTVSNDNLTTIVEEDSITVASENNVTSTIAPSDEISVISVPNPNNLTTIILNSDDSTTTMTSKSDELSTVIISSNDNEVTVLYDSEKPVTISVNNDDSSTVGSIINDSTTLISKTDDSTPTVVLNPEETSTSKSNDELSTTVTSKIDDLTTGAPLNVTKVHIVPCNCTEKVHVDNYTPADIRDCIGECPLENDVYYTVHLPHKNCQQYCKCDWGNATVMECPYNLHFNSELEVCDYPSNAKCTGIGAISTV